MESQASLGRSSYARLASSNPRSSAKSSISSHNTSIVGIWFTKFRTVLTSNRSSISEIKSGIRKNQSLLRRVARSTKELERRHRESSNTPTLPGDQYLKPRDRLDNGTSDSETDNEDEGGEVREPPAKRRSLSPEEEEGKVPRSPARTRSGRVFRPTIGASKIENTTDIQSKSPESSFSPPRDNPLVFGDLSSLFSSSGQPHPISKQIKPRRQQTRGVRGLSRSMPSLTPEWISPSSQTNLSSIFHDQEESGSSNKAGPSNDPIFSPGPRPPAIYAQASSGGGQGIQILTPPDTPNDEMIGDNFPVKPNKGKGTTISSREEFEVASSSTNKLKGVIQQQSHLKVTDLNEDSKLGSISCQPPTSSPNAQSSGTYGSSLASRNKQNKPLDISKYRQNFGDSKSQPDTISESHTAATSSKKSSTVAKATEADARKYRIPPGYSLKNWDPSEEPILLLGSVFDANSLGKWIYDWSVYHHGPGTPISNLSGELWLLLIQCFGKVKRSEEAMPKIRREMDREMIEDFIESGERLTGKLKKLLRVCEVSMVKGGRKKSKEEEKVELVKNAGCEFVDALFRKEGQLAATEKLMSSFRLWNLRFDANCEDILKRPSGS